MEFGVVAFAVFLLVFSMIVRDRRAREESTALRLQVARLTEMVRELAAHQGVPTTGGFTPPSATGPYGPVVVSEEVRRLAQQGKKIQAIKVLRGESGLGLAEAKKVVDQL